MSLTGFNFKQAFVREKPRSSVTDWIEILTASQTPEESYEGLPELVESINLQASGPAEVARALRKKMKRGGPHQQYRAIVIMRLLVENVPEKVKQPFAETQFLDILKAIWSDPYVDKRVRKRLSTILSAWEEQFKEDASMSVFAGLYGQLKKEKHLFHDPGMLAYLGQEIPVRPVWEKQGKEEREEKREREARKERERTGERRRRSFNFERDKDKVTNSIVNASKASSDLINAITRVNLETDTFEGNEEVQLTLTKALDAKKAIMRYTQLVEHEEFIGTLIETHERLQTVLDTYTQLVTLDSSATVASGVAQISLADSGLGQIQADNNAAIQRARDHALHDVGSNESDVRGGAVHSNDGFLHPDLADLDFNASAHKLPPPIRPTSVSGDKSASKGIDEDKRGSLSDYSDYESSDGGETFKPTKRRNFVTVSDDSGDDRPTASGSTAQPKPMAQNATSSKFDNDPFADPFA